MTCIKILYEKSIYPVNCISSLINDKISFNWGSFSYHQGVNKKIIILFISISNNRIRYSKKDLLF